MNNGLTDALDDEGSDEPRDAHNRDLDNDCEVRAFAEAFNYGTLAVLSPREILSVVLYQVKATKSVPLDTHLEYLEIGAPRPACPHSPAPPLAPGPPAGALCLEGGGGPEPLSCS